jgi:acyl carrier protein
MPTVEETILEYLNESKLIATEVRLDHKLDDDLALDSLDVVELTMVIEEKLGITIDDDNDINVSGNVGDLVESIRKKYGLS